MSHENNENKQNIDKKNKKSWLQKLLGSTQPTGLKHKTILIIIWAIVILFSILTILIWGSVQYKILGFKNRYYKASIGSIIKTADMKLPRSGHKGIQLQNENILIIGGNKGAEIFNTKKGQFHFIDKNLEILNFDQERINTLTLDNGNIVIAGKYIFDIKKNKFIKIKNYDNLINFIPTLKGTSIVISRAFKYKNNEILIYYKVYPKKGILYKYDVKENLLIPTNIKLPNYFSSLNSRIILKNNKYIVFNVEQEQIVNMYIWDIKQWKEIEKFRTNFNPNILYSLDFSEDNLIIGLNKQNELISLNILTKEEMNYQKFNYCQSSKKILIPTNNYCICISRFSNIYNLIEVKSLKNKQNIMEKRIPNITTSYASIPFLFFLLNNNELLITGGQHTTSNIPKGTTNKSYIYKIGE